MELDGLKFDDFISNYAKLINTSTRVFLEIFN
jgi:hypothetical protein